MGQGIAVFAEDRVNADFQFTRYKNGSGKTKIDVENLSGLTEMSEFDCIFDLPIASNHHST